MAANETRVVRLDFLSNLRASGADADAFLQGQLSNDVRTLSPQQGQLSSYNSPKGRLLAVLHLLRDEHGIVLDLHRSVADTVLKRLRMFVLRSRVSLESVPTPVCGVLGAGAAEFLHTHGLPAPETPLACARVNGITVMRRLGATPRFSVHGAVDWPATGAESDWTLADIEAGVPTIYPETQDRFVPQWCNLDRLGGISFDKGCYTGQEIVARVHYLGEVKRRMHAVSLSAPLPPGADSEHGEIVISTARPDGATFALAVQKI